MHTPLPLGRALRPRPGETRCGDQIGGWFQDGCLTLALADGLGHGAAAHAAAAAAMTALAGMLEHGGSGSESGAGALGRLFADCDHALADTRGVALVVARLRPGDGRLLHAGVGNIRTLLIQRAGVRRLGCARGIVGAGYQGLRPESVPLAPGDWLVLYSDGLPENAGIAAMLADADPDDALAAAILDRWAGADDDASLLLYRHA